MYLDKLKLEMKSIDREFILRPWTLVVGPHGSGKSAIVEGVALALTGKHPVGGRAQDLAELLPASRREDGGRVYAEVTANVGGSSVWKCGVQSGGSTQRPVPPASNLRVSIVEDEQWLSVADAKLREALFKIFADPIDVGAEKLSSAQAALLDRFAALDEPEAAMRAEQLRLSVELGKAEAEIETLRQRAKVSDARDVIEAELAKIDDEEKRSKLETHRAELGNLKTKQETNLAIRNALAAAKKALAGHDETPCPLCLRAGADLAASEKRLEASYLKRGAQKAALEESVEQLEDRFRALREPLNARLAALEAGERVEAEMSKLRQRSTALGQAKTDLAAAQHVYKRAVEPALTAARARIVDRVNGWAGLLLGRSAPATTRIYDLEIAPNVCRFVLQSPDGPVSKRTMSVSQRQILRHAIRLAVWTARSSKQSSETLSLFLLDDLDFAGLGIDATARLLRCYRDQLADIANVQVIATLESSVLSAIVAASPRTQVSIGSATIRFDEEV